MRERGGGLHAAPGFRCAPFRATSALTHEFVVKALAIILDQASGRMRKMDRQHGAAGAGHFAEQFTARPRRLGLIPIEHRGPVRLADLQRVMHQVADHDRVLAARADIDATANGPASA